MSEEKIQNGKTIYPDPDDPELDELLDECLEDFNKNDTINKTEAEASASGGSDNANEVWNSEFLKQQAKMMEGLLKDGETDTDALAKGFQKMAEVADKMMKGDKEGVESSDPEITASINEVLEKLHLNQEAAGNEFSAENFASMFQNLEGEGAEGADAFLPFMQNMMQSLLSAEILLPSLKELTEVYPGWLAEKGGSLPTTEKERYEKQLAIMKEVVTALEQEKPTDASDVRQARFNIVLDKMQKMQDLGSPPEELLAKCQGSGSGSGMPGIDPAAALPADCNLM